MARATWRDKVRKEYDYEYRLDSKAHRDLDEDQIFEVYRKLLVSISQHAKKAKIVFHGFPLEVLDYKNSLEPEEMSEEKESKIIDILYNDRTVEKSVDRFERVLESCENGFETKLDAPEHHKKGKDLIERIHKLSRSSKKIEFVEHLVFTFSEDEIPKLAETLKSLDRGKFNSIHLIEFSTEGGYYRTHPYEILEKQSVFLKSRREDLIDDLNKELEEYDGKLVEEQVLI